MEGKNVEHVGKFENREVSGGSLEHFLMQGVDLVLADCTEEESSVRDIEAIVVYRWIIGGRRRTYGGK